MGIVGRLKIKPGRQNIKMGIHKVKMDNYLDQHIHKNQSGYGYYYISAINFQR